MRGQKKYFYYVYKLNKFNFFKVKIRKKNPKIHELVFYNRSFGGWTKFKNEYIFEPYVTQAF